MESSLADQNTLMECDQMKFIFQYGSPFSPSTFAIDVAVHGLHWSKTSSTADMVSSYELFSPSSYVIKEIQIRKVA